MKLKKINQVILDRHSLFWNRKLSIFPKYNLKNLYLNPTIYMLKYKIMIKSKSKKSKEK